PGWEVVTKIEDGKAVSYLRNINDKSRRIAIIAVDSDDSSEWVALVKPGMNLSVMEAQGKAIDAVKGQYPGWEVVTKIEDGKAVSYLRNINDKSRRIAIIAVDSDDNNKWVALVKPGMDLSVMEAQAAAINAVENNTDINTLGRVITKIEIIDGKKTAVSYFRYYTDAARTRYTDIAIFNKHLVAMITSSTSKADLDDMRAKAEIIAALQIKYPGMVIFEKAPNKNDPDIAYLLYKGVKLAIFDKAGNIVINVDTNLDDLVTNARIMQDLIDKYGEAVLDDDGNPITDGVFTRVENGIEVAYLYYKGEEIAIFDEYGNAFLSEIDAIVRLLDAGFRGGYIETANGLVNAVKTVKDEKILNPQAVELKDSEQVKEKAVSGWSLLSYATRIILSVGVLAAIIFAVHQIGNKTFKTIALITVLPIAAVIYAIVSPWIAYKLFKEGAYAYSEQGYDISYEIAPVIEGTKLAETMYSAKLNDGRILNLFMNDAGVLVDNNGQEYSEDLIDEKRQIGRREIVIADEVVLENGSTAYVYKESFYSNKKGTNEEILTGENFYVEMDGKLYKQWFATSEQSKIDSGTNVSITASGIDSEHWNIVSNMLVQTEIESDLSGKPNFIPYFETLGKVEDALANGETYELTFEYQNVQYKASFYMADGKKTVSIINASNNETVASSEYKIEGGFGVYVDDMSQIGKNVRFDASGNPVYGVSVYGIDKNSTDVVLERTVVNGEIVLRMRETASGKDINMTRVYGQRYTINNQIRQAFNGNFNEANGRRINLAEDILSPVIIGDALYVFDDSMREGSTVTLNGKRYTVKKYSETDDIIKAWFSGNNLRMVNGRIYSNNDVAVYRNEGTVYPVGEYGNNLIVVRQNAAAGENVSYKYETYGGDVVDGITIEVKKKVNNGLVMENTDLDSLSRNTAMAFPYAASVAGYYAQLPSPNSSLGNLTWIKEVALNGSITWRAYSKTSENPVITIANKKITFEQWKSELQPDGTIQTVYDYDNSYTANIYSGRLVTSDSLDNLPSLSIFGLMTAYAAGADTENPFSFNSDSMKLDKSNSNNIPEVLKKLNSEYVTIKDENGRDVTITLLEWMNQNILPQYGEGVEIKLDADGAIVGGLTRDIAGFLNTLLYRVEKSPSTGNAVAINNNTGERVIVDGGLSGLKYDVDEQGNTLRVVAEREEGFEYMLVESSWVEWTKNPAEYEEKHGANPAQELAAVVNLYEALDNATIEKINEIFSIYDYNSGNMVSIGLPKHGEDIRLTDLDLEKLYQFIYELDPNGDGTSTRVINSGDLKANPAGWANSRKEELLEIIDFINYVRDFNYRVGEGVFSVDIDGKRLLAQKYGINIPETGFISAGELKALNNILFDKTGDKSFVLGKMPKATDTFTNKIIGGIINFFNISGDRQDVNFVGNFKFMSELLNTKGFETILLYMAVFLIPTYVLLRLFGSIGKLVDKVDASKKDKKKGKGRLSRLFDRLRGAPPAPDSTSGVSESISAEEMAVMSDRIKFILATNNDTNVSEDRIRDYFRLFTGRDDAYDRLAGGEFSFKIADIVVSDRQDELPSITDVNAFVRTYLNSYNEGLNNSRYYVVWQYINTLGKTEADLTSLMEGIIHRLDENDRSNSAAIFDRLQQILDREYKARLLESIKSSENIEEVRQVLSRALPDNQIVALISLLDKGTFTIDDFKKAYDKKAYEDEKYLMIRWLDENGFSEQAKWVGDSQNLSLEEIKNQVRLRIRNYNEMQKWIADRTDIDFDAFLRNVYFEKVKAEREKVLAVLPDEFSKAVRLGTGEDLNQTQTDIFVGELLATINADPLSVSFDSDRKTFDFKQAPAISGVGPQNLTEAVLLRIAAMNPSSTEGKGLGLRIRHQTLRMSMIRNIIGVMNSNERYLMIGWLDENGFNEQAKWIRDNQNLSIDEIKNQIRLRIRSYNEMQKAIADNSVKNRIMKNGISTIIEEYTAIADLKHNFSVENKISVSDANERTFADSGEILADRTTDEIFEQIFMVINDKGIDLTNIGYEEAKRYFPALLKILAIEESAADGNGNINFISLLSGYIKNKGLDKKIGTRAVPVHFTKQYLGVMKLSKAMRSDYLSLARGVYSDSDIKSEKDILEAIEGTKKQATVSSSNRLVNALKGVIIPETIKNFFSLKYFGVTGARKFFSIALTVLFIAIAITCFAAIPVSMAFSTSLLTIAVNIGGYIMGASFLAASIVLPRAIFAKGFSKDMKTTYIKQAALFAVYWGGLLGGFFLRGLPIALYSMLGLTGLWPIITVVISATIWLFIGPSTFYSVANFFIPQTGQKLRNKQVQSGVAEGLFSHLKVKVQLAGLATTALSALSLLAGVGLLSNPFLLALLCIGLATSILPSVISNIKKRATGQRTSTQRQVAYGEVFRELQVREKKGLFLNSGDTVRQAFVNFFDMLRIQGQITESEHAQAISAVNDGSEFPDFGEHSRITEYLDGFITQLRQGSYDVSLYSNMPVVTATQGYNEHAVYTVMDILRPIAAERFGTALGQYAQDQRYEVVKESLREIIAGLSGENNDEAKVIEFIKALIDIEPTSMIYDKYIDMGDAENPNPNSIQSIQNAEAKRSLLAAYQLIEGFASNVMGNNEVKPLRDKGHQLLEYHKFVANEKGNFEYRDVLQRIYNEYGLSLENAFRQLSAKRSKTPEEEIFIKYYEEYDKRVRLLYRPIINHSGDTDGLDIKIEDVGGKKVPVVKGFKKLTDFRNALIKRYKADSQIVKDFDAKFFSDDGKITPNMTIGDLGRMFNDFRNQYISEVNVVEADLALPGAGGTFVQAALLMYTCDFYGIELNITTGADNSGLSNKVTGQTTELEIMGNVADMRDAHFGLLPGQAIFSTNAYRDLTRNVMRGGIVTEYPMNVIAGERSAGGKSIFAQGRIYEIAQIGFSYLTLPVAPKGVGKMRVNPWLMLWGDETPGEDTGAQLLHEMLYGMSSKQDMTPTPRAAYSFWMIGDWSRPVSNSIGGTEERYSQNVTRYNFEFLNLIGLNNELGFDEKLSFGIGSMHYQNAFSGVVFNTIFRVMVLFSSYAYLMPFGVAFIMSTLLSQTVSSAMFFYNIYAENDLFRGIWKSIKNIFKGYPFWSQLQPRFVRGIMSAASDNYKFTPTSKGRTAFSGETLRDIAIETKKKLTDNTAEKLGMVSVFFGGLALFLVIMFSIAAAPALGGAVGIATVAGFIAQHIGLFLVADLIAWLTTTGWLIGM
ncbi:MAG: MFS transporter, partial [Eubacterium sp.]|nr:MFS transporter [Eubacterium sp.]